jgi:hypothetical protein
VNKYDDYHRAAEHCLQMALNAPSDEHRSAWLTLAQGWLQLIPAEQIKIDEWSLEAAIRAKATRPG